MQLCRSARAGCVGAPRAVVIDGKGDAHKGELNLAAQHRQRQCPVGRVLAELAGGVEAVVPGRVVQHVLLHQLLCTQGKPSGSKDSQYFICAALQPRAARTSTAAKGGRSQQCGSVTPRDSSASSIDACGAGTPLLLPASRPCACKRLRAPSALRSPLTGELQFARPQVVTLHHPTRSHQHRRTDLAVGPNSTACGETECLVSGRPLSPFASSSNLAAHHWR